MRPPPDVVKKHKPKATGSRGDSGSGLDKPKPIALNPPKGDVATSGGNYGKPKAEKFKKSDTYRRAVVSTYTAQPLTRRRVIVDTPTSVKRTVEQNYIQDTHRKRIERNRAIAKGMAKHDVMTHEDITDIHHWENAAENGDSAYMHALVTGAVDAKGLVKLSNGIRVPAVLFEKDTKKLAEAGFKQDKVEQAMQVPVKILANTFKEGADIPTNAIPSLYAAGKPAVEGIATGDPKKALKGLKETGKALAQPYVELYKHPGKTIVEHPLSTALMVAPVGKFAVGSRAVTKTVAGTGIEETTAAKGVVGRVRKPKVVEMDQKFIKTRVDENVAAGNSISVPDSQKFFAHEFSIKGKTGKPLVFATDDLARKRAKELSGTHELTTVPYEGGHVIVPKSAAVRLKEHMEASTQGPLGKTVSQGTAIFRRTVLATPKWLTGNVVEAGVRALVNRAGPTSYFAARKTLNSMNLAKGGIEANIRTVYGGHYHLAGEDLADMAKSMVEAETKKSPTKAAFDVFDKYSRLAFSIAEKPNTWFERQAQTAQLGRAMRQHGLMGKHTLYLTKKATREAAEGLQNTNTMAQLGREVDRAYGQYAKFSPRKRQMIATYTPFLAWQLNAVRFLYDVMPRDHPVLTAAVASAHVASEDWRKQNGQHIGSGKPMYLQGGIPGKDNSVLRVSRYTPMGIWSGDEGGAPGSLAGTLLPQVSSILANFGGRDWKLSELSKNPDMARNAIAAATTLIEQQLWGASIGLDIAGVHKPNEPDNAKHPDTVEARARKRLDPFRYTPDTQKKSTSSPGFSFSGDDGGFDFGSSSGGFDFTR